MVAIKIGTYVAIRAFLMDCWTAKVVGEVSHQMGVFTFEPFLCILIKKASRRSTCFKSTHVYSFISVHYVRLLLDSNVGQQHWFGSQKTCTSQFQHQAQWLILTIMPDVNNNARCYKNFTSAQTKYPYWVDGLDTQVAGLVRIGSCP